MPVAVQRRELPAELQPFDDPDEFEERYEEEKLLGDILAERPNTDEYESRCVMVFGIPEIGQSRLPKLKAVMGKIFGLTNSEYKDHYPLDSDGNTKGYCFVEYPKRENADTAVQILDGHALDKNHTFSAYNMIEIKNIQEPDSDWKPPTIKPYNDVGDLWWWLQNPRCEDQFATLEEASRTGEKYLSVWWNTRGQEPREVEVIKDGNKEKATRSNWSEQAIFKWSPEGSYLATFHSKGVMLWAGPTFEKFQRFEHNWVNFIEFSPKETYLVTFARDDFYRNNSHVDNQIRIFDTFTGELKKILNPRRFHEWPYLKWSADEKYFGFSRHGQIHIYETEHFELLNKTSIELDGLISFEFNPAVNLISYYCEERVSVVRTVHYESDKIDKKEYPSIPLSILRTNGVPKYVENPEYVALKLKVSTIKDKKEVYESIAQSAPVEIGVMQIPSQEVKRAARIYNVSTANLYWQKAGNYLAAHTERYQSRKIKDGEVKLAGIISHLEIFDCTQKDVSVQTLQLTEPFVSFGWDPKADKFCVLVGSVNKVTPLVYKIASDRTTPQLISQIEAGIQLNTVSFAPSGGWLAVYGSGSNAGIVFFIDTNSQTTPQATRIRIVEHASMNYGSWDPTGRYFVTCAVGHHRMENGYRIHTFQGRELFRRVIDGLARFRWRPRPPSTLTETQIKDIRKNLKIISKKFEDEDRKEQAKASEELIEKRRKIMEAFNVYRESNRAAYEQEVEERLRLRSDITAAESDYVEETITIPLTTEVKPLANQETAEE